MALAPANQSEPSLLLPLVRTAPAGCAVPGDRNYSGNYGGRDQAARLAADGLRLVTPPARQARRDPEAARGEGRSKRWAYSDTRYLIEAAFGQMTDRFGIKRVRARDLWHLTGRIYRKVLAHKLALILNIEQGNRPLQFERLLQV